MLTRLKEWWQKPYAPIILLIALTAMYLCIYRTVFGFHPNNDTESYIDMIRYFRGDYINVVFSPGRYLSPWYAVMSATVFWFLSPVQVIVTINIISIFAVVLSTYGSIRRVFSSRRYGLLVALLLLTHYAWVRYGLTQVQDLGAYMWYALGLYSSVRWYDADNRKQRIVWALLLGVCVSFGLLTKETGAMSAVFFTVFVLRRPLVGWFEKIYTLFLAGFLPFITLIINQWRGMYIGFTSRDWYFMNWASYKSDYTPLKWFGVHVTSFHILLPCIVVGIVLLFLHRKTLDRRVKEYGLAVLLPSLSYFAWPSFIARTVVISAWLLLPIAVYTIEWGIQKKGWLRGVALTVFVAACFVPSMVQYTIRYAPMFILLDYCSYKPVCVWQTFWQERRNFTTQGNVPHPLFQEFILNKE
jgi:4-amino-4-deoxy-L-arabinose transferase-like glycosyltransferase